MLQVGCSHPGFAFPPPEAAERFEPVVMAMTPNGPTPTVTSHSPPTPPYTLAGGQADKHNVVVHWTQGGHSFTSGGRSDEESSDTDFRPFTPPPPRERLSYTRYQLELLNGIYKHVKYPNSTQKLLVAKRVGITRDQVKIWFQNRRRKDVLSKQGKKDGKVDLPSEGSPSSASTEDQDENKAETMVPSLVMDSVITELMKFKNEHLKSKKQKGKKRPSAHAKIKRPEETALANKLGNQKMPGFFTGYDMISPPNQITPTAFPDKFTTLGHAKQSAFERPIEKRPPLSSFKSDSCNSDPGGNRNHLAWQSFLYHPSIHGEFPADDNSLERSELSNKNFVSVQTNHSLTGHTGSNQQPSTVGEFITRPCNLSPTGNHLDNIPVLSDLLGHSGRQYSCDVRSREAWRSYGQENLPNNRNDMHLKYRVENHGMMGFQFPAFPTQIPIEPLSPNRRLPVTNEAASMTSTSRQSELFRPQPYYASSFTQHDTFQSLPLASLSNPFHPQHQSFAPPQQWHDISIQDQRNLQL